jgi:hypothetical protein
MANTRFNYDSCRTIKRLQESTDIGRYILNAPGNGTDPGFIDDRHIIPQKWGGNLMTNTTNLESSLMGVNKPLFKGDCINKNNYENYKVCSYSKPYKRDTATITEESRYISPAWEIRNIEIPRWNYLPDNPQNHIYIPFEHNNIDTRILSKDYYLRKL